METNTKARRDAIQKQMDDMADQMYRLAKPVEHTISIKKID